MASKFASVFLILLINLSVQCFPQLLNGTNFQNAHFNARNLWLTINAAFGKGWPDIFHANPNMPTTTTPLDPCNGSLSGEIFIYNPVVNDDYFDFPSEAMPCNVTLVKIYVIHEGATEFDFYLIGETTYLQAEDFDYVELNGIITSPPETGPVRLFLYAESANVSAVRIVWTSGNNVPAMRCENVVQPLAANWTHSIVACYIDVSGDVGKFVAVNTTSPDVGANLAIDYSPGLNGGDAEPDANGCSQILVPMGAQRLYMHIIAEVATAQFSFNWYIDANCTA